MTALVTGRGPTERRVAALVLAAGEGSRLGGVPKAALRLPDGRTFLAAIAEAARAAGCRDLIVVAAAPHEEATRAAAAAAACDRVATNADPTRGMASSVAAGLAALAPAELDAVLVWPVDHPRVRASTVAAIVAAATRDRVVVPVRHGRGGHPTAFGSAVLPELAGADRLARGLRDVLARDAARVVRLPVEDPGVLLDVDTPADLAALRRG